MQNYYSDQALNNVVAFYEDKEYFERKETFLVIANCFRQEGIGWAVGCSMNLFFRGIVDDFHDLDLIVDIKDVEQIEKIMKALGANSSKLEETDSVKVMCICTISLVGLILILSLAFV